MELRKELPEIFEDFAQARKNSFVTAKQIKDQNIPMIGVFCTYFPQEIANAMGATVVSLCSTSDETIPDAEKDLPRNLCPLVKSSYGFAKTDKCPYFYFADLVVGETTCDGKKKMYEYLADIKPVHVMELPNTQSEDALILWKKEVLKLKDVLEEKFGVEITEENVREACRVRNAEREALKRLYALPKLVPSPLSGNDVYSVLYGTSFKFDKAAIPGEIDDIIERTMAEYNAKDHTGERKPRIIISGCPLGGVNEKVIGAIERAGAEVVAFENCNGAKSVDELIDADADDIYEAIARRYLNIGCSVMTPNPNRLRLLDRLIDEYQADAVVDVTLTACLTYNIETLAIKRFVTGEKGIPYMNLETDYSTSDAGQINTRMAAFVEML